MFSDPSKNIDALGLEKGMHVADFGAGSGFYAIIAARAVGDKGKVYAIDIQKDLLVRLKNQAAKEHVLNVEIIWGDLEKMGGTKLREFVVDRVLITNILFQIENKENVAKEALRILKPGGKVLLIDWRDSFGGLGPHQKDVLPAERAKEIFEAAGFVLERKVEAGDHHYGFLFKTSV